MKYCKLLSITILIIASCNPAKSRKENISRQLMSNDVTEIIKACNVVGEKADTTFILTLLHNPYDPRISNSLKYKGISVYQAKMNALRRISGLNPPNKVTYEIDTANIAFYVKWEKTRKYVE